MFNKNNREKQLQQYNESDHIDDYLNILNRLKKERKNYKEEPYTRTIDQIEYHIRFFEDKLEKLK